MLVLSAAGIMRNLCEEVVMDQGFRVGQEKKTGFTGVPAGFVGIVICVLLD
jgi:hypothetical protein